MTQQATVLSSLCRLREPRQGCCLSEHAALLQFNGLKRLGLKLFQIVKYSNPILHMTLYMGLANSLHSIWQLCQHVQVIRCNTTKNFSYTHLVRPNLLSGQIKNLWKVKQLQFMKIRKTFQFNFCEKTFPAGSKLKSTPIIVEKKQSLFQYKTLTWISKSTDIFLKL